MEKNSMVGVERVFGMIVHDAVENTTVELFLVDG